MIRANSPRSRDRPRRLQHPSGTRRQNGRVARLFESIHLLQAGPVMVRVSLPDRQQTDSPRLLQVAPPGRRPGLLLRTRQTSGNIHHGLLNNQLTGWPIHRNNKASTDRGVHTTPQSRRSRSRPMSGNSRPVSQAGTVTVPGRDIRHRCLPMVTGCRNMCGKPEYHAVSFDCTGGLK